MTDYTDLCARLRHNCECDSETMYQCDSCTASYAIDSLQRDLASRDATIAELQKHADFLITLINLGVRPDIHAVVMR